MEKPSPYVIRRVNKWITCEDEDGPQGLSILVRQYITNAERDDLVDASNAIREYSAKWLGDMSPEERTAAEEANDTPRDREWKFLAPYIVGWNVQAENEAGEVVDVPAPADGGPDVFRLIPAEHYTWI